MPASDDKRRVSKAPPQAAVLPPTEIRELDDVDVPVDLHSEHTRAIGTPKTDPDGTPEGAQEHGPTTDPPPPLTESQNQLLRAPTVTFHLPEGPPGTARTLASRPAQGREAAWQRAGWAVLGAMLTLGVVVILIHVASSEGPADGPIRVVAATASASPHPAQAAAARTPRVQIDPDATIDALENQAADHLANGRLPEAADVYAALARRVPHQRAYAAAARILAERTAE
jgi:hypothetical protein